MSENNVRGSDCFKEAVCINAGRIYDSCGDKECLSNVLVMFKDEDQALVDNAASVKAKCAKIITTDLCVHSIPFNRGFYSVDITFYIGITFDVLSCGCNSKPVSIEGLVIYNKQVVLFGSEGNVKTFSSETTSALDLTECSCCDEGSLPEATVSVAPPVVLATELCECTHHRTEPKPCVPKAIQDYFGGNFTCKPDKLLVVTLGVFSIVSLKRDVSVMVPVYDFCLPNKDCSCTSPTVDPCEMFRRLQFPVDDFFPPKLSDTECQSHCDCNGND